VCLRVYVSRCQLITHLPFVWYHSSLWDSDDAGCLSDDDDEERQRKQRVWRAAILQLWSTIASHK
jgi:hypothetical protein